MEINQKGVSIALVKGNEVLMQLRDNKPGIISPGKWCLPGGAVEEGESILAASKREFEEETGYISKKPFLFYTEVHRLSNSRIVHRNIFVDVYDKKQKINCYEGQKMEFVDPEKLKEADVHMGHKDIAIKALRLINHSPSSVRSCF